jgi:hypothetical protein
MAPLLCRLLPPTKSRSLALSAKVKQPLYESAEVKVSQPNKPMFLFQPGVHSPPNCGRR